MADAEVVTAEAPPQDEPTLYDRIVEQTGIKYDAEDYMSVAAYKYEVCSWFQKEFPNDVDFEDPAKVAPDIQEVINETTKILHNNKGARVREPLPVWQGLPDPDDVDSRPKRGARKKATSEDGGEVKPKAARKPRAVADKPPPGPKPPNRYLRVARALIQNPKLTKDELAEDCDIAANAAGYCMEAFVANFTAFKESGHLVGFDDEPPAAA